MMKHILYFIFLCLSISTASQAQLVVVEDRGGTKAQTYYDELGLTPHLQELLESIPLQEPTQKAITDAYILPIRSALLTPGHVQSRAIHAPGLMPVFLIGDDDLSKIWLKERLDILRKIGAVGLVVNVETAQALQTLKILVGDLMLSPVSGDDLARRLQLSHYPVLITATGIEQ